MSASLTVEIRCDTMIDVRSRMTSRSRERILLFGIGVHRRQGIVENQDARVDDDGARESRALFLSAGERDAALPYRRLVALREIGDILVETRDCRGGDDRAPSARRRPSRCERPPPARPAYPAPPALPARPAPPMRPARTRRCHASVSENRKGSCGTKPIALRSVANGMSRTSMPSMNTVPGGGSCKRASSEMSVDFPEPVPADESDGLAGFDRRGHVIQHERVAVRENKIAKLDGAADSPAKAGHSRGPVPVASASGSVRLQADHDPRYSVASRGPRASFSTTPCRAATYW